MDISTLAKEHQIDPAELETVLDATRRLLASIGEEVRPANKKAIRGIATRLAETISRVTDEEVRERLVDATYEGSNPPEDDDLARYVARCEAQDRLDHAVEGARTLLEIVRAAEEFEAPAGRPRYARWTIAIGSLLFFYAHDLGRDVTVSAHHSDPRGVRPSRALHFVHQCMLLIGEDITEQACRTILQNVRGEGAAGQSRLI